MKAKSINVFTRFYLAKKNLKVSQSQIGILVSSNLPTTKPILKRIFALVSKMGEIKKINALYLSNTPN